jgi:hypothetical protein
MNDCILLTNTHTHACVVIVISNQQQQYLHQKTTSRKHEHVTAVNVTIKKVISSKNISHFHFILYFAAENLRLAAIAAL